MNFKVISAGFALLIASLLMACAAREIASPQTAMPSPIKEEEKGKLSLKEAWEQEWDKILQAAKKEGSVIVYGTMGSEPRAALSSSFNNKFAIKAEFITGKGAEISQRLLRERRAGIYMADVYVGGPTTLLNALKPSGVFETLPPYIFLPEILEPKVWYGGRLPYLDRDKVAFSFAAYASPSIAINTELVREPEVKSYQDLLNPKWKGKIVMNDPTVAGSGSTWFTMVSLYIMNLDYMRQLVKQSPTIIRDQRLQVEWLARGRFAIAITPKPEEMGEFIRAGAPIKNIAPEEGMYLTMGGGNAAVFNLAPHPKAAKLFVNWLLSREGQIVYSKYHNVQSAREDIPTDFVDPIKLRQPDVKYFATSEEFFVKEKDMWDISREIFGVK